jgi:selenocysteine lyase/cysteine desulfurase
MIYFNSGWISPMSDDVFNAIKVAFGEDAAFGPASLKGLRNAETIERRCRAALSRLLSCEADDLVITHGSRDSINHVLESISWNSSDKIVTTNLEHPALSKGCGVVAQRFGVDIHVVDIDESDSSIEAEAKLVEAISKTQPRLVAVSHIQYMWGLHFSLEKIGEAVRNTGGMLLIDGAQSAGLIPIRLDTLNIDFYTISGQKRLGGPSGTGALFVRNLSESPYLNDKNCFRYLRNRHLSEHNVSLIAGLTTAVEAAVADNLGEQLSRIIELAGLLRSELRESDVQIVGSPDDNYNGMLAVSMDGIPSARIQLWLEEIHKIIVRKLPTFDAVRLCIDKTHDRETIIQTAKVLRDAAKTL